VTNFGIAMISYRILDGGLAPRRITLSRPGWSGTADRRVDGSTAQPWHCAPFTEGATYGVELLYPFETRCEVINKDGQPHFLGSFDNELRSTVVWPPFQSANPGHYSMATLLDLAAPHASSLRVEPHPRFFTDQSGEVPVAVIGNVQTHWWPLCLFVTFKSPRPGERHVFEKGMPYCQVIVVPNRRDESLRHMEPSECAEREMLAQAIMRNRARIRTNGWVSHDRLAFDDVYKQLRRAYQTGGLDGIRKCLFEAKVGRD